LQHSVKPAMKSERSKWQNAKMIFQIQNHAKTDKENKE